MKEKHHTIEIYRENTSKKEWRWRMISSNGRNVANGGESYKRKGTLIRGLQHMFGSTPIMIKEENRHIGSIQQGYDA